MATTPTERWRLILTPPADGATNMAIDEALLEQVTGSDSPPILRLYSWEPACLSIGYAQPVDQVDRVALRRLGWGLVRRPTGGRAILHVDELTYAVITPATHPIMSGGVLPSYQRISLGLSAALENLSLVVERQPEASVSAVDRSNPVCFEVPSAYELTVQGRKLVGSAQVRRRAAVLQHGSLPLTGDITRIVQGLRFDSSAARREAAARLADRATTVEALCRRPVAWERAAECWIRGFADALRLEFEQSGLTPVEQERADRLRIERYSDPEWTERA